MIPLQNLFITQAFLMFALHPFPDFFTKILKQLPIFSPLLLYITHNRVIIAVNRFHLLLYLALDHLPSLIFFCYLLGDAVFQVFSPFQFLCHLLVGSRLKGHKGHFITVWLPLVVICTTNYWCHLKLFYRKSFLNHIDCTFRTIHKLLCLSCILLFAALYPILCL